MNRELSIELLKIQMLNRRINHQGNGDFRATEVYSSSAKTNYRFLKSDLVQEFIVVCLDDFFQLYDIAETKGEVAKSFAYFWQTFISIHPFTNGNGRTAKEYLKLKASEKGLTGNFDRLDQFSFDSVSEATLKEYCLIFEELLHETNQEENNIQLYSSLS